MVSRPVKSVTCYKKISIDTPATTPYHKGIVSRSENVSNSKDKFIVTNLGSKSGVFFDFSLANFLNGEKRREMVSKPGGNHLKKGMDGRGGVGSKDVPEPFQICLLLQGYRTP